MSDKKQTGEYDTCCWSFLQRAVFEIESVGIIIGLPSIAVFNYGPHSTQFFKASEKGGNRNLESAGEFPTLPCRFAADEVVHSLK